LLVSPLEIKLGGRLGINGLSRTENLELNLDFLR
jgi:hypothetical protein